MITSGMAEEVWGKDFRTKVATYPNRIVMDAKNRPVTVVGVKYALIKIGNHLPTKFPIVIYQADHKEMLLGYAF